MPAGILHQGTQERTDFLQNLCISNKNTMFPHRAQNILQRYDLYGSPTFLTFVSQKSPEYILFFCKMWIITYVGKVKNSSLIIWILCSLITWILFVTLFTSHLYFCLEFFKRLGSCKVTYTGKVDLVQRTFY